MVCGAEREVPRPIKVSSNVRPVVDKISYTFLYLRITDKLGLGVCCKKRIFTQ